MTTVRNQRGAAAIEYVLLFATFAFVLCATIPRLTYRIDQNFKTIRMHVGGGSTHTVPGGIGTCPEEWSGRDCRSDEE